jgi:hypothetical protein
MTWMAYEPEKKVTQSPVPRTLPDSSPQVCHIFIEKFSSSGLKLERESGGSGSSEALPSDLGHRYAGSWLTYDFFCILIFFKKIKKWTCSKLIFKTCPSQVVLINLRDLWSSHISVHNVTYLHMDTRCQVNLIGSTTSFDTQNDSRHFKWCDSSMSRVTPFDVTHLGSKSAVCFLIIDYFL